MGFFYDDYPRRRSTFSLILLVLVSAIIGGLLSLSLVPFVYGPNMPLGPLGQPKKEANPQPVRQLAAVESPVVIIAEEVGPTVVGISNQTIGRSIFNRQLVEQGSGSGVIISQDGYIVTNYHVIAEAEKIVVTLADDRQVEAQVRGSDPETDLAILKINADNLPVAALGDSNDIKVGEQVVAIGNPLGAEFARSVTAGVVSAKERYITIEDRKVRLIQTDAAINPGNSGGALVNTRGEVIGINSAKLVISGVEGMGFAIPISDAKPIINELIESGYISRPALGIWGVALDKRTARQYDLSEGIYIREPIQGGAAHKAGLQQGDVIISLDGKQILNFDDLNTILKEYKPGDEVEIIYDREGKKFKTTLILEERGRE